MLSFPNQKFPRCNDPRRSLIPHKTQPAKLMNQITILLAEDHLIVRDGLHALLSAESDMKIIAQASDGQKTVELARKHLPDVVVMDIAMPTLNGIEATRQILKHCPETKVLILSAHSDDAYVQRINALGASGYLIKQSASHILPLAIREIMKGKIFFSPSISLRLQKNKQRLNQVGAGQKANELPELTCREMEVLQLIAEGKANKHTADQLGISIKTVEKHRQNLMEKLNIHDTAGLTRYAIAEGVIESRVQETTTTAEKA
jgi:DNA-binding NarL/FixJ family response regulator